MRKGRWSRILGVFLGMTMIAAMICVFPLTSGKLFAGSSAAGNGVCYISFSDRDADSVKAQIVTKNYNSGEIVTAYFNMSMTEIQIGAFPDGAKLVEYNSQSGRLVVSIQGKNGNPNGSYSFMILGTNIKDLTAKLQMAAAKPGDGPGAPGEGPGGGPGGPGGGPGEGPGGPGGPGANPGEGPGKNDPKKPEETQATTVTNTPTPAPTSTPVPTNTPVPTPSATPAPATATPVPKETAAPAATSAETTVKPETSAVSETEFSETTLPETTEVTIPESQDTSSSGETTEAVAPGVVDPADNTDPSSDVSDGQITPSVTAAEPASKTTGRSYLWIFILLLLLVIIYLRYRHLSKKGMSFPEIMKNFIPVGALIAKLKPSKKEDNYKLDGPQPEVMNGYLQKPTVGVAAARAIRPVRSNTTSASADRPKPAPKPAAARPAASRQEGTAPKTKVDPELHEIELRQRELEQKMKEISSQKEKLPEFEDE